MTSLGTISVDHRTRSTWLIRVVGEYDLANISELEAAFDQVCVAGGNVVVDLSHAAFVDSSVIGVLVAGSGRVEHAGYDFAIAAPVESFPRRVLTIAGVGGLLGISDSVEGAFATIALP